jgi:uncharacterized protein YcbK (DUF882 family)
MTGDQQLTPHFNLSEFRCKCCGAVDAEAALRLAYRLEEVRTDFGPMLITSGFRCPKENLACGGKADSQHLIGLAADIFIADDNARFRLVIGLLQQAFKRIGIGQNIVHADIGTITGPIIWTYYK